MLAYGGWGNAIPRSLLGCRLVKSRLSAMARAGDLGAAFRGDRQRCSKAKRRQHLAAGAARGVSAGSDCQPAGPDAGRDRRGDAQTPDRRQPQRGVAVLRSPQHQLQKKTLYAAEQKRADVARARRRWMREQGMFDPARLVFIDETCTNTAMVRLRGRAPRGERLVGYAPHGQWKTITFVGGLRQRGMTAPFVLEGAINGPMFLAYVKQCLVPTLRPGEIVLMGRLPAHKVAGIAEAIEAAGATLIYLPKYSPDLNPIELACSKLKAHLRKAAEHTILRLLRRIGRVVADFSPQECRNFFRHAGYART